MPRVILVLCLASCSRAPSQPEPTPSPVEQPAQPQQQEQQQSTNEPSCQPQVREVLFLPDDGGFDVTILGQGFCVGAGPASAQFGDVQMTNIVVASSGTSMAGHVDRMPPSGAILEIQTPPGPRVVTGYAVP